MHKSKIYIFTISCIHHCARKIFYGNRCITHVVFLVFRSFIFARLSKLFIHGTKDESVPYAQSTSMCAKMKSVGASCEVHTLFDAPHGIGGWEKVPAYQNYKEKMVEWLKLKMQ